MEMPAKELHYQGLVYDLVCEKSGGDNPMIILTYEHRPVKEDSYLLSVIGETYEKAAMSMIKHLKLENIS